MTESTNEILEDDLSDETYRKIIDVLKDESKADSATRLAHKVTDITALAISKLCEEKDGIELTLERLFKKAFEVKDIDLLATAEMIGHLYTNNDNAPKDECMTIHLLAQCVLNLYDRIDDGLKEENERLKATVQSLSEAIALLKDTPL